MKVLLTTLIGFKSNVAIDFLIELGIKKSDIFIRDSKCTYYSNNRNETIELNKEINLKKDIKKLFLYGNLKKCCVSSAFFEMKIKKGLSTDEDNIESNKFEKKTFVSDFLKENGKGLLKYYHDVIFVIEMNEFLKVKFENLTGVNERDLQVKEYRKIVDYLGIEIDNLELESKISNIININNYEDVYSNFKYDYYFDKTFFKTFKFIGFAELNKDLGYKNPKSLMFNLLSKITNPKQSSFYDKYWKINKKNISSWSYGINIVDNLINNYQFKTVLDAGCGSADVVRYLLSKGYDAQGIELSHNVLKTHASDLLKKKKVLQGSLSKLPHGDNTFDVIFSSEVLEHIPKENISKVIEEFYRVSKRYVFLTISLRPSSNFNKYHITLQDRDWWEKEFLKVGFIKESKMVEKLQTLKLGATNKEVLEIGPTKSHIHEMDWFIKNPPLDFEGELEPWYFIFKKSE